MGWHTKWTGRFSQRGKPQPNLIRFLINNELGRGKERLGKSFNEEGEEAASRMEDGLPFWAGCNENKEKKNGSW
jgi:hypothetical protein